MAAALAVLASVLAGSAPGEDARTVESRLDARLRLIHRAEREAVSAAGERAEAGRERVAALVARLGGRARGEGLAFAAPRAVRLPVLVSSSGDCRGLEATGFRLQAQVGRVCTGSVEPEGLAALAGGDGVRFVQSGTLLQALPFPPRSTPASGSEETQAAARVRGATPPGGSHTPSLLSGDGVIVAFVDTGVDIFHQDFRKGDGTTRIRSLLDLSDPGDVDGDGDLDGAGPHGGTLYTEAQINAALTGAGSVREKDTTGHGTHGLSIAAGDDPALPGLAPAADLVVVKATREDGTLGFVSTDVINALAFVDAKAKELGKPYVANLSLGTIVASHDGRSLEEQAIDELFGPGRAGKAAVLAAGNSSDNRSATRFHHFGGVSYVGLARTHALTVPAYTPTPGAGNDRVLLDLWYRGRDKLAITVTPPGGSPVVATFGSYVDVETPQGNVFVCNLGGPSLENGDIEAFVLFDDWAGTAPASGEWAIALTGEQITDGGEYDGWLADESAVGAAVPYLSGNADNRMLVGKPGTAHHGITVGAFARHDAGTRYRTSWTDVKGQWRTDGSAVLEAISEFSSPGPTRDGRVKPELAAPGERVLGALSREAHPCLSPHSIYRYHGFAECDALVTEETGGHGFGLLQGTSFAAPVVTGLAARVLSTNAGLDAVQVRNVLVGSALVDSYTGVVPNEEWGYGKADLTVGGATLPSDLRITTDALPAAVVDEGYEHFLGASGGKLPYAWSLDSGSLPPGLALDGRGGIGGVPATTGTSVFTVRITDSSAPAQTVTRALSLEVQAGRSLEVVTRALPPAHVGVPYAERLEARGGTGPYAWSLLGGALPAGLALHADGRVTGEAGVVGRSDFTVEVRDAASASARGSVRLKVTREGAGLWDPLGLVETTVNRLAVDPADGRHLFASTRNVFDSSQDALFETKDAGETWRPISINNNFNGSADWLDASPATSEAWAVRHYDGVHTPEVFRYDPAGALWVDTDACAAFSPTLDGLGFDGAGTVYAVGQTCSGTSGDVRRSMDQGASWSTVGVLCGGPLDSIYAPGSLAVSRTDPGRMYASRAGYRNATSTYSSFTCRSADGGATWQSMPGTLTGSGANYLDLQVSSSDPLDVVRGVYEYFVHSVERSVDGGTTWTRSTVPGANGFDCCLRRAPSDPAVLLYGASASLHRSVDHGQTWTRLAVGGRSDIEVTSLVFDPADVNVFYVGSDAGVFRTADGGATWALRSRGLVRRGLSGLAISTSAPSDLLLATTAGTPYVSRTGGERWTSTGVGLSGFEVLLPVISSADPDLFLIQAELTGLFRSTDRGVTWTQVTSDDDCTFCWAVQAVDADPFDPSVIVIGVVGRDLYRSTDRGETWAPVALELGNAKDITFARGAPHAGRVYAALSWDGIARSDDHGASWAVVFDDGGRDMRVVEPAPSDARRVYAAGGSTVYSRDPCDYPCANEAAQWHAAAAGPARPVLSLAVEWGDPLVAYAGVDHPGTAGAFGGIYKTTDGGHTWSRVPGALDSFDVVSLATHPTIPGTVWAATAEGGVFRSADGGQSWTALDRYGTVGEMVNVTLKHPGGILLFAGTEGYGVQVSSDGGRTFSSRVTGLTNLNVNALAFEPGSSTVLYAGTDAGIFKSTDTGNTWAPTGLGSGEITDLATDTEGTIRRIWGTVRGEGVAYSADGGATFAVYSSGLASLDLTSLELEIIGSIRRIWGTTRGGDGVYCSDDLGQTWESAGGSGLTDHDVTDFTHESSAVRRIWGTVRRIWATTQSGAFYSDNDGLSWTELSLGLPSGVPLTSVSIDPHSNEVMVSLFSDREGGVYRGANLTGLWSPFSEGLDELKVRRLTRDGGRTIDPTTKATTFYAATAGDGSYASEVRTKSGTTPAIATASLPGGTLHVPYAQALVASGGSPPYAWSVPEGLLPAGLSLNGSTGAISGEPGRAGVFGFSVQVSDTQGRLDRRPFTVEIADPNVPTVTSFSPLTGFVGSAVTVTGTSFLGTTAVAFGGVLGAFTVQSATSIQATVPAGARTGPIGVTNASGTGRSAASFTVIGPPTIAGFSPSSGYAGLRVTVTGTGLTGATAVTFNGVSASFGVDSATQIGATVPVGATTGPIGVTTPAGTATSAASFTVVAPPPAVDFYTVTPCRLVDTRRLEAELGGPALVAGQVRTFTLVGPCTIPPEARALSVNVTVTAPTAQGNLRLYPAGIFPVPTVSTVNYAAGQTRANNAIAALSAEGRLSVLCTQPGGGTAHLVLDVNGYFR